MRWHQATVICLLLALVGGVFAWMPETLAQEASPGPLALPLARAPFGLGSVALPSNFPAIEALLGELPKSVAGEVRGPLMRETDRVQAPFGVADLQFGPPMALAALSFSDGDFFPRDFTAGDFVATASMTDDYDATSFGRDGTLVWIRAETTVGVAGDRPGTPTSSRPVFTLAWGYADSPWLFTAAAISPDGLDALVAAFVVAAGGQTVTPVAHLDGLDAVLVTRCRTLRSAQRRIKAHSRVHWWSHQRRRSLQ